MRTVQVKQEVERSPMNSTFETEVMQFPTGIVLRLTGELRLDASPLERQLLRLSAARPALLVIDLGSLSFISSLGMGMLNAFRKGIILAGGVTKIAAAQPQVAQALRLCNFDKLFEMHDTVDAALGAETPA